MGEKNRWSHFSWTDFDWIHLLIQLILKPSQTPLSPRCCVLQSACTLIPPSLSSLLGLSSVFLLPFPVLLPSDVLRKASPPAPCPLSAPTTHKASPVPLVGGRGEDGDKDSKASFSVFELQRFGAIALLETSDCRSRMWLQVINVIFPLLQTSSSQRFSGLSAQDTLSDHPWDCFLLSPASLWGCSILMLIWSWCLVSVAVNAFVRPVLCTHPQIKIGSGKTPFSSESHQAVWSCRASGLLRGREGWHRDGALWMCRNPFVCLLWKYFLSFI